MFLYYSNHWQSCTLNLSLICDDVRSGDLLLKSSSLASWTLEVELWHALSPTLPPAGYVSLQVNLQIWNVSLVETWISFALLWYKLWPWNKLEHVCCYWVTVKDMFVAQAEPLKKKGFDFSTLFTFILLLQLEITLKWMSHCSRTLRTWTWMRTTQTLTL